MFWKVLRKFCDNFNENPKKLLENFEEIWGSILITVGENIYNEILKFIFGEGGEYLIW